MRLIGNRPLCTLCLSLIFSCFFGVCLPRKLLFVLLPVTLLGVAAVILSVRMRKMGFYTGCMAVCLLLTVPVGFGASSRFYDGIVHRLEARSGEECTVEGLVLERQWSFAYQSGFLLRVDTLDQNRLPVTLLLECAFPADCQPGDRIRLNGTLAAHEQEINGFSRRSYYLARGVALSIEADAPEQMQVIEEDVFDLTVAAARLNTYLAARFRLAAGEETGRLLSAIFLGRRNDLEDSVVTAFKRLGLSHLLALSGLHLSLLTGAVGWLLVKLHLPRGWRTVLQLLFVLCYVLLTGAPVSVLRAALMLALTCLASAFFDEADSITALFGAAALICLTMPSALLDIGLWMSVFATLGMLVCHGMNMDKLPRLLRAPARAAAATAAANLMTLPFAAIGDGILSLVSVFTNLLFVPLMSFLLYCAPVVLLGGGFLAAPVSLLAKAVLAAISRIARAEGITATLQHNGIIWLILPLLAVCIVLLLRPPRKKRYGLLALGASAAVFFAGLFWVNSPPALEVVYTRVSQSEALVLRCEAGTVICDIGDGSYTPLRAAASYAAKLGADETDTLMLTHYHTKHISAVRHFIGSTTLRCLLLPEPASSRDAEIIADLEEIASTAGVEVRYYPDGLPVSFGEVTITSHTRTCIDRSVQPLILLHLKQGGEALTYIGSSVRESDLAELAEDYAAQSRYLIFGDHGPNPRETYLFTNLSEAERIILASADTLTYMLPAPDDGREIPVVIAERIRLRFD